MAALASSTWGIEGPTFLALYAGIALVVGVAVILARRRIAADPAPHRRQATPGEHPHDIAYLNNGAELAVFSALSSMHLSGTIVSTKGSVRASGQIGPDADPLERAIHQTAGRGEVHRTRLPFHRPVAGELAAIEARLVAGGLLLSADQRRRIRRAGGWLLAVAGLGMVRLLAGVVEARPVGLLAFGIAVVAAAGVLAMSVAPRRSRDGDRTLAELRDARHDLAPDATPDWTLYGPATAALGIGLYGTGALWASDPAFAEELALQRASSSGDGAGSAAGGDGGGDGGGGGGGCGGGCGG